MSHPPPSFFAACRNSGTVECDEQWQIFVCNLFAQKLNQNYHIMPRVQKHDRIQNVNNVAFVLRALAIHFAALPDLRQGQPRTNKRQCGIQPAHQSLITDVFRSRPLLCTIHHLINSTLASVENVPVVPAVLDKGHQSKRTRRVGGRRFRVGPIAAIEN
jgi:hypothetical protein